MHTLWTRLPDCDPLESPVVKETSPLVLELDSGLMELKVVDKRRGPSGAIQSIRELLMVTLQERVAGLTGPGALAMASMSGCVYCATVVTSSAMALLMP